MSLDPSKLLTQRHLEVAGTSVDCSVLCPVHSHSRLSFPALGVQPSSLRHPEHLNLMNMFQNLRARLPMCLKHLVSLQHCFIKRACGLQDAADPQASSGHVDSEKADSPKPQESPEPEVPLTATQLRYKEEMEHYNRNLHHVQVGDHIETWSFYPLPHDDSIYFPTYGKSPTKKTPKPTPESTSQVNEEASGVTPESTSESTPKTASETAAKTSKPTTDVTPKGPSADTAKSTSEASREGAQTAESTATEATTPKSTTRQKKRKRAPSPDVIPNPPGCSYGMYEEYFYYSDSDFEDEEESSSADPIEPSAAVPKSAMRKTTRAEQPPPKKVRFGASPQDSPSKLRLQGRATDPYTGSDFLMPGQGARVPAPSDLMYSPTPATRPTTAPAVASPANVAGPASTTSAFTPSASVQGRVSTPSTSAPTPSAAPAAPVLPGPVTGQTRYVPTACHCAANNSPSPTSSDEASVSHPTPSDEPCTEPPASPSKTEGDEAVAKVRSQAEKFKPKTPSGLRTASRYSSPLTALTNVALPKLDFGNDDYARDAEWLYKQCPSGKLDQLKWPRKQNMITAMNVDSAPRQLLTRTWNNLEMDANHATFRNMMESFSG